MKNPASSEKNKKDRFRTFCFVMVILLSVLNLASIIVGYIWDSNAEKLRIDESVLEYISDSDWTDDNFLASKGFEYSDTYNQYSVELAGDNCACFITVSSITEPYDGKLKQYKDIKYHGNTFIANGSWKRIFNNNTISRHADFYIEEDNIHISVCEITYQKNEYEFVNFFK